MSNEQIVLRWFVDSPSKCLRLQRRANGRWCMLYYSGQRIDTRAAKAWAEFWRNVPAERYWK